MTTPTPLACIDPDILAEMHNADGTNWTPLAISNRIGYERGYVKNRMRLLYEHDYLDREARGLYRLPDNYVPE